MAREFSKKFYHTQAWKKTRQAYFDSQAGLCELCKKRGEYNVGEIVHHKIHLSPDNMNDLEVLLNFDNLQLVCRKCHAEQHPEIYPEQEKPRVWFDEDGRVVKIPESEENK